MTGYYHRTEAEHVDDIMVFVRQRDVGMIEFPDHY